MKDEIYIGVERKHDGGLILSTTVKGGEMGSEPYWFRMTYYDYTEAEARELFLKEIERQGLTIVD